MELLKYAKTKINARNQAVIVEKGEEGPGQKSHRCRRASDSTENRALAGLPSEMCSGKRGDWRTKDWKPYGNADRFSKLQL